MLRGDHRLYLYFYPYLHYHMPNPFFLIMKTKDYCISYCYKIGGRILELKSEVFMVIEFSKTLLV